MARSGLVTWIFFELVMGVLREMLDQIDRQRRSKMMSEAPDPTSLEHRRTSMQQMYYLASRANAIRLPEEYLLMASMGKRPSFGSNSSLGSNYSVGRHSPRRTSIDMRYTVFDPPKQESVIQGNKYLLSVDEAYSNNRFRRKSVDYTPSTPELQSKVSQDSLGPKAYRRHSSFQGLGVEEQAVLDKIVRERRASLAPSQHPNLAAPHILVSGASGTDLSDAFFFGTPRRASTQSMGPVVVPEPGRRDSKGRLLDLPTQQRRSSFQGICESAMQFFVGK